MIISTTQNGSKRHCLSHAARPSLRAGRALWVQFGDGCEQHNLDAKVRALEALRNELNDQIKSQARNRKHWVRYPVCVDAEASDSIVPLKNIT